MFSQIGADISEEWNIPENISEADEVLEQSKKRPQLLYKHSNRCGTCMFAKSEIEGSTSAIKKLTDMHFIDVIGNREVSNHFAEKLNLRHESPQAILLVDGKVVWHASHSGIKSAKILEALR